MERPINANQVLGNEAFNDIHDAQDDDELLQAAEARGEEKRLYIMQNVLPPRE